MAFLLRWRTSAQLGALIVAIVVLSSAAIGWTTYSRLNRDLVAMELSALHQDARLMALQFDAQLESIREDLRFLSDTPPMQGYFRAVRNGGIDPDDGASTPEIWLARLESLFSSLQASKSEYLQIRVIAADDDTVDLLRIDSSSESGRPGSGANAPQTGSNGHVRQLLQSAVRGRATFSEPIIGDEAGTETSSPNPFIHGVLPVHFGDEQAPSAAIVITLAVNETLNRIGGVRSADRHFVVLGETGHFVAYSDETTRFGSSRGAVDRHADQWPVLIAADDISAVPETFTTELADGRDVAVGSYRLNYEPIDPDRRLLFAVGGDLDTVLAPLHALRRQVAMTVLALLAGAILAAILLSNLVTRRLRALTEGARAVAAGDFDVELPTGGGDEISELASDMSAMAQHVRDKIAQLQAAERELGEYARFLTSIIDNVPTMIFVKDAEELRFVRLNPAAEAITGYAAEDLLGKNDFDFFPEEEARFFTDSDRAVLRSDSAVIIGDEVITRGDGSERILYTKKVAIRDEDGGARYLLGISEDVTERRRAERKLLHSERRFRAIFETAADGIITIDRKGTVTAVNPAASRMFGWPSADVIGQNVNRLMPEPYRSAHDGYLKRYLATGDARIIGTGREVSGVRADGTSFPMWLSVAELAADDVSAFAGIVRDLSREKEDERELIEARRSAEDANRAKSEFLAAMSHELRTPLNAIIGYSEMLADEARSGNAGPAEKDLEKIRVAGRHLLMLINDILDLSKIEARRIDVDVTQFSPETLIREVADTVRPLVEENGNTFEVSIEPTLEPIHTDPTRVRQILMNLLSNAAKFTEGGVVRLSGGLESDPSSGGTQLVIRVRDSGIGIEREQLDRIFDAFSQADKTTTREYGGTGLGLAITRGNCDLLGGEVSVTSEPGKGSEFTVRLPVDSPDISPSAVTIDEAAPGDEPAAPRSNTILIIEDDPSARELLVNHLQGEGWQVAEASSGPEGLKLAQELRPCAIVLDVIMPEVDGWAVLRILKNDAELSRIPVVLCTIVDDRHQGFALGAADYLTKPVSREDLVATLSRYCLNPPCDLLIVEDDAPTRELFGRAARRLGWRVMEAVDGERALRCMAEQTPDLILLDLMMPKLDGFGVIEALQRDSRWRDIPVVVATAKELTNEDRQHLNGYVEAVVSKNTRNLDELIEYVVDALARVAGDGR